MTWRRLLSLTHPTRKNLRDSTAPGSPPSTKTELEQCGWEDLTDFIGLIVKIALSRATRKSKACRAARFDAFWKIELAGFGSALRRDYPGSILRVKRLETMTCPTAYKAMSTV